MKALQYLRSCLFYLGYALSLLLFTPFCLTLGWFMPIRSRYRFIVLWNRFTIWWLGFCCGVRYHVSGLENLPAAPYVMVSNHQSPWETIFLYFKFVPLCATLKAELLRLPFFGWTLWMLNPIAIDRNKRREALSTLLTQGTARLEEGISVLIFPEGTRVEPGQHKKYSYGAAELAIANAVPIVPLAHNAGLFWPAHKLVKLKGTVEVVIAPAISTTGREARELTDEIQQWTIQVLERIS